MASHPTTAPAVPRPTTLTERAFVPDFARGIMLLLIVLSNTALHLHGDLRETAADAATRFTTAILIDVRTYPLFAFLFGYGITQLAKRQRGAGVDEPRIRRLLRRRGTWLFLFGFAHAALLLTSEVLAAYGLLGLLLVGIFFGRRDRTLLTWAVVGAGILAALFAASAVTLLFGGVTAPSGSEAAASIPDITGVSEENWFASILPRVLSWLFLLGVNGFGIVMPTAIVLGMWAARRRILEEPHRHLRLLRATAITGITIGLAGSLPIAFIGAGAQHSQESAYGMLLFALQWTSGLAGGLGYVGLFGLLGYWLSGRASASPPVVAVTALGKRSLSGYLSHSVLMAPVLAAWGLDLGADLSAATVALFGIVLWLLTVIGAYLLERTGRRGPAEVLLRKLMYRRQRA